MIEATRAWSYPAVDCTSLEVTVGAAVPRRLVAMDGLNLLVLRGDVWCHNERCGAERTFPLRAAAMTTVFPSGARERDVREGDIEINALDSSWLIREAAGKPNLRTVLLHEVGHLLGFPDLAPLPAGDRLDSVMREQAVALQLTDGDVRAVCARFPR